MLPKITARNYYDANPQRKHAAGDIWSNLPTHGLLRKKYVRGLVITPACDLANRKVETVTYLPVIPIREWLCTPAFIPECTRTLRSLLAQLDITSPEMDDDSGSSLSYNTITNLSTEIKALERPSLGKKESSIINRCFAGLRHCRHFIDATLQPANLNDISLLFGEKQWSETCDRLIRNAARSDVHFLPCDEQDPSWSGIAEHSLVLFRYPLTASIDIFDAAQDLGLPDWEAAISALSQRHPLAAAFLEHRPIKHLKLQTPFLSDLLTRFGALYLRLGSPDFSHETVTSFSKTLRPSEQQA